jgi:hypothetical protein
MKPNWAEDNLQTIRTLMERSALYRRALAPVMIFCGIVGIVGGIVADMLGVRTDREFVLFWSGVASIALAGTFFLVRRQALKDSEPLWSSPTKKIAQALIPPFTVGALIAVQVAVDNSREGYSYLLIAAWCFTFGCGIHSAGFFMPRGIKFFGWLFIFIGLGLVAFLHSSSRICDNQNFDMATIFGGLHLAYGIYLYFTEKKNPAA